MQIFLNMMKSNSFQLYIRKFYCQILSKLLLAVFGSIIVSIGSLALTRIIYLAVILLYFTTTLFFLRKQKFREFSHLVDMLFVNLLLFGAPLDNYVNFAFLLFPLVSRGTYVDRFTYDKCFFLEYIALLIILNLSAEMHDISYYYPQIVVIGMFGLLNRMYVQRMKYDEKRIQMLDIADDYFIAQNKSYEVYKKIIEYLVEQKVRAISITCLESDLQMKKFHLINSSYLVSTWRLKLNRTDISYLQRGMVASNVDFVLDGKKQERNEVYCIAQTNTNVSKYFFFVITYQKEEKNLKDINLEPLFLRMARLISFERIIRSKRDKTIQDMLQKSRFVNGATNVMHFLKNRLTPLQTLVDLAKNEGGVKQLDNYDILLKETAYSAQKEIDAILEKAEYLLNKQNNPFVFSKEDCDAHNIFFVLSLIWSNLLPDTAVMSVEMGEESDSIYESNIEGLEILFSDIVGNMQKYSKNIQRCSFRESGDTVLTITFENDFCNKRDTQLLINDINNPNKDAVIYRTSYGIANIRAITDNIGIGRQASLVTDNGNELYHLELKFEPKKT